jgi:hypothetical protein
MLCSFESKNPLLNIFNSLSRLFKIPSFSALPSMKLSDSPAARGGVLLDIPQRKEKRHPGLPT